MWTGSAAVCKNKKGEILMVLQGKPNEEKKWSVPSGGRDKNETYEECCIREVFEETGYKIKVGKQLFVKAGVVHYFEAEIVGGKQLINDPDGLIYEIAWKSAHEIESLKLSFEEDRDFLIEYISNSLND